MEIILKAVDELIPYENNPRINDEAVKYVAESIKQCDYIAPIIVDEDMVILAGHTRLKALKSLGYEECEVLVKRGLTEEQKKKYRILDNKTSEYAEWDAELLDFELDGIDFGGFDFGLASLDEIDMDLGEFFEPTEPQEKEPKKIQCPHCGEWIEI